LVRQAFISLYPGTFFDESMTELYGSENSFFLRRSSRAESIAVFVTPEPLDSETLAVFSRKAADAEIRMRESRSQSREFLVSIVAAEIPERIKVELNKCPLDWFLFEYLLLQSEMDDGLALKPVSLQRAPLPVEAARVAVAAPKAQPLPPTAGVPDRRLSPEELSALIDLSLGLEMRSREMN